MTIKLFILILAYLSSDGAGTISAPYATEKECAIAAQQIVVQINQEQPEGILSAKAGCVEITLPPPPEKKGRSL